MPAALHAPQRGAPLLPSRGVLCQVSVAWLRLFTSSHPLLTSASRKKVPPTQCQLFFPPPRVRRLLHVRNGNCKYHLGEETFKLAQSYMDKLAKHGHQANKAALYGELCALLFAKSHYDEVSRKTARSNAAAACQPLESGATFPPPPLAGVQVVHRSYEGDHSWAACQSSGRCPPTSLQGEPASHVLPSLRCFCSATSAHQPCLTCVLQACVVKREFRKAEQLIKHAVFLAR